MALSFSVAKAKREMQVLDYFQCPQNKHIFSKKQSLSQRAERNFFCWCLIMGMVCMYHVDKIFKVF